MKKIVVALLILAPFFAHSADRNTANNVETQNTSNPGISETQDSVSQIQMGTVASYNRVLGPCEGSNRVKVSCRDSHPERAY